MLQSAIILFREMLEITLIVSIVAAATSTLPKRGRYILFGITIGIFISLILAFFTSRITSLAEGPAQEFLNAGMMAITVVMIGYTVIWMKNHIGNLRSTSIAVKEGKSPLIAITTIIAAAVLREGAEIILFCHSLMAGSENSTATLIIGGIVGSVAGISAGILLYFGLINFFRKSIFTITNCLLILLASSLAAQIPNFLASAGVLTEFSGPLWNSSWLLSERSSLGKILHMMVGYTDQPSAMQLIFYLATLFIIGGSFIAKSKR